ncbi:hypothetical protein Syun_022978 [Stephania yunnanensis]|uniref:DNA-directed RNA polymerase n=1 Tax=Stephania yunnanensis TaxID=152371 RepID=A0AAP0FG91_9MAGN
MDSISDALEKVSLLMANIILPVLLETVVKGDPRVEAATIIWVSPDASNWVRNPGRARKGETICGSDTKRSIPHAIKQVQELVDISCAFDQVVERLSRSVKMVAKGVLKDHLLPLASSMTCTVWLASLPLDKNSCLDMLVESDEDTWQLHMVKMTLKNLCEYLGDNTDACPRDHRWLLE